MARVDVKPEGQTSGWDSGTVGHGSLLQALASAEQRRRGQEASR